MNNLCIIWDEPLNINGGGIHRCINFLLEYLPSRGVNVYYLYSPDNYKTYIFENNISYTNCQLANFIVKNSIRFLLIENASFCHEPIKELSKLNHRVKIISRFHSSLYYYDKKINLSNILFELFGDRTLKYKSSLFLRTLFYPIWKWRIKFKTKKIYLSNYLHSDLSILLSEYEIPILKKIVGKQLLSKCKVINNPLTWEEDQINENLDNKKNEVIIVARLYNCEKRIDLALRVWKMLQDTNKYDGWVLRIIGDGIDGNALKRLEHRLKIKNVIWEGRKDPVRHYQNAAIFLLTSSVEGWALTLTEAMQHGVVPVAFDSYPAVKSIITHEYNGFLIPNGNVKMMAKKIEILMQESNLRQRIAQNCIKSCHRFVKNDIADEWYETLMQLNDPTTN